MYFSFEDVMKYASSTLLFAEYMDQKDKSDQSDLIKTTLEFLITNEFIALVHVKKEEVADVLTKGTSYVCNSEYVCWPTMCVCVFVCVTIRCSRCILLDTECINFYATHQ